MSYVPSYQDVSTKYKDDLSYVPSYKDVAPRHLNSSAANELLDQISQQNIPEQKPRQPLSYNPIEEPGFENLSKEEKLKRISLSQFDPGNIAPIGRFMPPGALDAPSTRMAATTLPLLAQPEINMGESGLAQYVANPLVNALARIGSGTASNVAYQAPNINSMQQLKDVANSSATMNAVLEGIAAPFKVPGLMAEMKNPINYTARRVEQIRNEYPAAQQAQEAAYKIPMDKYGNNVVTIDPKKYLGYTEKQISRFTPEIEKAYDDFISSGTFQHLHDFQKQVGSNVSAIGKNPVMIKRAQTLRRVHDIAKQKIQGFLSRDPEALNSYNEGIRITRDVLKPYETSKKLRSIAEGMVDPTPSQLISEIKKGTEKTAYRKGRKPISAIPEDHPLRNHLSDLTNIMHFGETAKYMIPAAAGAISGEILHPGILGTLGGAGGLLTSAGLGAMGAKFGGPSLANALQNPALQKFMRYGIKPAYYTGGHAGINVFNEPQGNQ